ncbi:unnamed protein product, partial [Leptidea sinapis]
MFGLKETEKSNRQLTMKIIEELNKIDVDIDHRYINYAKRFGKKETNTEKDRPIVVQLINKWKKIEILQNKKKRLNKMSSRNTAVATKSTNGRKSKTMKRYMPSPNENDHYKSPNIKNSEKPTPKVNRKNAFDFMRNRSNSLTMDSPNNQ